MKGINNSAFDSFNLATHSTTQLREPPAHRGNYIIYMCVLYSFCTKIMNIEFCSCTESIPTMPKLLNFRAGAKSLNIPREIGTSYNEFGIHLLQDASGGHLRSLERELNRAAEDINCRILQEWLEGKGISPVSWTTLIDTLRTVDLNELAKLIEQHTVGTY